MSQINQLHFSFKLLRPFALILVLALSCQPAKTQDPLGQKVDQLFKKWDKPNTPGVTVAVVRNGEVIHSNGYGMANLEYDIPNEPSTIFHIASVSKQFTNFAVLLLAEEGKVSMDDDIRKYIPEVPDFGKRITLRHLATHTSGMRDQWNLLAMAGWRLDDVITKEHIMKLVAKQQDLNFEPGEEYLYCNTGYTLLAEVVARVSGDSFAEFTQERIFKPLGMERTLFYDDHEKIVPGRAYSYYKRRREYKKKKLNYANVGATSLFTTVEDLAKWAINFETPKVGSVETMRQMHTRGILNNGDTITYALGQGISKYKGLNRVSHSGGDANFRTYLARFPDQRFSVMIFSNGAGINPGEMGMKITDIYLKDEFTGRDNNTEVITNTRPEKVPMPRPEADYTGTYYSPELSTAYEIKFIKGRLIAEHMRHKDIRLNHSTGDTFRTQSWFFGNVEFVANEQGQVTQMLVSSGRVRNVRFNKMD